MAMTTGAPVIASGRVTRTVVSPTVVITQMFTGSSEPSWQSFVLTETLGSFNMTCTVSGGGVNGQAGAVRMGVARALQEFNPELRPKMKAEGFMSRDARQKERKKYGQKGARKRFQFSKR